MGVIALESVQVMTPKNDNYGSRQAGRHRTTTPAAANCIADD